MQKCRYFNNHQTATALMIDDLSLTATTTAFDKLNPLNDWGFGLNNDNSLYKYFDKNLLAKYPEVKGTFFIPLKEHAAQNCHAGYNVFYGKPGENFKNFIKEISGNFDFAFHGITHGKYIDPAEPCFTNWKQEFEYLTPLDIPTIAKEIRKFEEILEVRLIGGKYPGYKKNGYSEQIIEELKFKWWACNSHMINKSIDNRHSYIGKSQSILDLPTNLDGSSFNYTLKKDKVKFWYLNNLKHIVKTIKIENYLQYLYENRLVITIQEHFQNMRTDGNRQVPNVADDINSLDKIYGILRGADIWYATCNQLAHYIESFDHSELKEISSGLFNLNYSGKWDSMFLSVISKKRELINCETGAILKGIYVGGNWVYNDIKPGTYRESHG